MHTTIKIPHVLTHTRLIITFVQFHSDSDSDSGSDSDLRLRLSSGHITSHQSGTEVNVSLYPLEP